MARIAGIELPGNKRIEIALTYIYGVGPARARQILAQVQISGDKRAKDLANGFLKICQEVGMALPAGESASVRYLVNPAPPVKSIP